MNFLIRFFQNISAATAIEYGLIVAAIALAIVGVIFTMGDEFRLMFDQLSDQVSSDATGVESRAE